LLGPLLVLFLGLLSFAAWPAAAQEQAPNIRVDVRAAYDGAYRAGEWFPVYVTVTNDGPDLRGSLEWSFPGQRSEPTFQRAIDLPRGSSKRYTLEVFSRGFARNGQLRVIESNNALVEQNVSIEPVDPDRFLVAVVSVDPALLSSLTALQVVGTNGTVVRNITPDGLPERMAALRGVNAIFLHEVDTGALSAQQRASLGLWVSLGGQLVLSGGLGGEQVLAGIQDLAPVRAAGGVAERDLGALQEVARQAIPQGVTRAPTTNVTPLAGSEPIPPGAPLLYRWGYGVGTVTFSTFDIAALRGWVGEPALWSEVLLPVTLFVPGVSARLNQTSLLQNVLQLPALGLPSAGVLAAFLLGYILVIGPLNYLALRRFGRPEWAWLTIPLAVLLFAGGLYIVGFGGRGGQSQLNQVAIVQGSEARPDGLATAYVGLFSPRRASYSIGFPAESVVSETRSFDEAPGRAAPITSDDQRVEVPDVLVDVASVRTLVAETPVAVPVRIASTVREENGVLRGSLRYDGRSVLEDVLVVRGVTFQSLGTLAPGAQVTVDLANAPRSFPWGVMLPEEGLFNRKQLLNALFSGDAARLSPTGGAGGVDSSGTYLIGWSNEATLPVSVNGIGQGQSGLTLYIIRLREA
jgi:hypothetical protein